MTEPEPKKIPATRYYIVTGPGDVQRLVNAASAAQALRHVTMPQFRIDVASAADVVALLGDGVKPENAGQ